MRYLKIKYEKNVACLIETCEALIAHRGDVSLVTHASGQPMEVPAVGEFISSGTFEIKCPNGHARFVEENDEVTAVAISDDDSSNATQAVSYMGA